MIELEASHFLLLLSFSRGNPELGLQVVADNFFFAESKKNSGSQ